jgi:hypothetical protein
MSLERIDLTELRRLYDSVQEKSVRWEGRQIYAVPWENEDFATWKRGEPLPANHLQDYLEYLRERRAAGHRTVRVRGLKRPITDYTRFEFEVAYVPSAEAGQETVVVDMDKYPEFDGHDDFAVFDRDGVMWYRYDDEHHLLGYDYSDDPALVADRAALLDRMLAVAVPFTEVVL